MLIVGTTIHNIELKPGAGGQMARSAGAGVQLVAKGGIVFGQCTLKEDVGPQEVVTGQELFVYGGSVFPLFLSPLIVFAFATVPPVALQPLLLAGMHSCFAPAIFQPLLHLHAARNSA